jgi:hypothetical protein
MPQSLRLGCAQKMKQQVSRATAFVTISFYSEKELRRKKGRQRKRDREAKTEAEKNQLQAKNSLIQFPSPPTEIHDDFAPPLE